MSVIGGIFRNRVNKLMKSGSGPLYLAKVGVTQHSLGTDDVLLGGKMEIQGTAYFNGNVNAVCHDDEVVCHKNEIIFN